MVKLILQWLVLLVTETDEVQFICLFGCNFMGRVWASDVGFNRLLFVFTHRYLLVNDAPHIFSHDEKIFMKSFLKEAVHLSIYLLYLFLYQPWQANMLNYYLQ